MEVNNPFLRNRITAIGVFISLGIILLLAHFSRSPSLTLDDPTPAPTTDKNSYNSPIFNDETFIRGINHSHVERSKQINALHELFGSGVCPIDINNDGWTDLFFVGGSGSRKYYGKKSWWAKSSGNVLYLNKGNGYFEDVSVQAKINDSHIGMGCAAADLNQNGYEDLVLTTLGGNYLYENLGNNQFKKVTLSDTGEWSTSVSLGDANNDGLLDFYITNFINYSHHTNKYEPSSGHNTAATNDFNTKAFKPQPNFLFINQGHMNFSEESVAYGVENSDGRSVFSTWHDINHDGFLDLFVGNKEGSNSKLFINQASEKFKESTDHKRYPFPKNYHSLSVGDVSENSEPELIFSGATGQPLSVYQHTENSYKDISSEYIQPSNTPYSREQFGSIILDFNQDGLMDHVSASGYMLPDTDSHSVALGQPNLWLVNDGKNLLTANKSPNNYRNAPTLNSSRSILSTDIDNDGDDDIVISNNNHFPKILINQSNGTNNKDNRPPTAITTSFLSSYQTKTTETPLEITAQQSMPLSFSQFKVLVLIQPENISLKDLVESYKTWNHKEKVFALRLMSRSNIQNIEYSLIQQALYDSPSIAIIAIKTIAEKNLDAFLYQLLSYINNQDSLSACGALKILEYIFSREESFIRHKPILASELTRNLKLYKKEKAICAIQALAKSRSKRPIQALSTLALSKNIEIAIYAVRALGELKQAQVLKPLTMLARTTNKKLANEARSAIAKISGTVSNTPISNTPINKAHYEEKQRLGCKLEKIFENKPHSQRQVPTVIRLCSQQDQELWVSKNTATLSENYTFWLSNWKIPTETYELFLTTLLNESPKIGPLLIIKALALNPPPNISEAIANTLLLSNITSTPEKHLLAIANNGSLSSHTRIDATEILIQQGNESGTLLIKQLLEELFHEDS